MKKFDLELALAGHPLVTRNGEKILNFVRVSMEATNDHNCIATTSQGNWISVTDEGKYYADKDESIHDLFLDDSIPWVRTPKMGDIIEVKNTKAENWKSRIFIKEGKDNSVICVYGPEEGVFKGGTAFATCTWYCWRWPEEEKQEVNINIKLNGKPLDLNSISKETWERISKDLGLKE